MATIFYHIILLLSLLTPICRCESWIGAYCTKNFKGDPALQANIDSVLAYLGANTPYAGLSATYSGNNGTKTVHGLAQCRADVSTALCSACIANATRDLPLSCPGTADARIWYDYCFLRYKNKDFIGRVDTGYVLYTSDADNATANPEAFAVAAAALLTRLRGEAVVQGHLNFAKGQARSAPAGTTIYGLVDCTRDLSSTSCARCLSTAISKLPIYCQFKKGCQIHYSSCSVRYEVFQFFFP